MNPLPLFWLWVPAVESGTLALEKLVLWADDQILDMERPPLWILELSAAKDLPGLYRAANESENWWACPAGIKTSQLYIGYLYFQYAQGDLPVEKLLLQAGQFADCNGQGKLPPCEDFYLLLNERDGGGPAIRSKLTFEERLWDLFEESVEALRAGIAAAQKSAAATYVPVVE